MKNKKKKEEEEKDDQTPINSLSLSFSLFCFWERERGVLVICVFVVVDKGGPTFEQKQRRRRPLFFFLSLLIGHILDRLNYFFTRAKKKMKESFFSFSLLFFF